MESESRVHLALGADRRFAMPLAVAAFSAIRNIEPTRDITLFVMDGGIGNHDKRRIRRIVGSASRRAAVEFVKPDLNVLSGLETSQERMSVVTYFRVILPLVLPRTIDKVIYLDSDVVVTGDLSRLWDLPMEDRSVLAVQGSGYPYASMLLDYSYKKLGMEAMEPMFNGGLMVLDLSRWRQKDISKQIMAYLMEHRDSLNLWDQDGLNAVLQGDWCAIDPRWNQTHTVHKDSYWESGPLREEYASIKEDLLFHPYAIHFSGSQKPWDWRCRHPVRDVFLYYLRESRWYRFAGLKSWRVQAILRFAVGRLRRSSRALLRRIC